MAAKTSRSRKVDKTGRSKGEESHFRLHQGFAQSAVIRSLSGPAMKIWIELHARYNGFNNGQIGLSYGEAAKLLSMSKTTASRAFKELQTRGLIKLSRPGHRLGRRSAEWEVTDQKVGSRQPSREYKDWRPSPKAERASRRPKTRPTKTGRKNTRWYSHDTQGAESVPQEYQTPACVPHKYPSRSSNPQNPSLSVPYEYGIYKPVPVCTGSADGAVNLTVQGIDRQRGNAA